MLHSFDKQRDEFKPYGLSCVYWSPSVMTRPDRHNEIEINYLPKGDVTYMFQGNIITVPEKCFTLFWGLVPHQVVNFNTGSPYYVCTIPFAMFLEWKLPTAFVDRILRGEVLFEKSPDSIAFDEYLLKNWMKDINSSKSPELALLEIRARLGRMANRIPNKISREPLNMQNAEINHVEKMAAFIARNYTGTIKASDIGGEVGLHPDYANSLFKKTFGSTLSEYIIEERISHVQRKLVTSSDSITQIAFECGFNSISRFNAAFLKINKCTPREYRNRFKT